MCRRKSRNCFFYSGPYRLQGKRLIWAVVASFSVAPGPTRARSGTVSLSSHLLLPACLSQVCHRVSGHLLFLSLCYSCSFLPVLLLCLEFSFFLPPYCFTSLPCFVTRLSIVSLPSAVPFVPDPSPVISWLTLSSLSPPYLLFW